MVKSSQHAVLTMQTASGTCFQSILVSN